MQLDAARCSKKEAGTKSKTVQCMALKITSEIPRDMYVVHVLPYIPALFLFLFLTLLPPRPSQSPLSGLQVDILAYVLIRYPTLSKGWQLIPQRILQYVQDLEWKHRL